MAVVEFSREFHSLVEVVEFAPVPQQAVADRSRDFAYFASDAQVHTVGPTFARCEFVLPCEVGIEHGDALAVLQQVIHILIPSFYREVHTPWQIAINAN